MINIRTQMKKYATTEDDIQTFSTFLPGTQRIILQVSK